MEPSPDLATFIELVTGDPKLLQELAAEKTLDGFAATCAAAAAGRDLRVSAEEVRDLLRDREIRWFERNVR